MTQQEITKQVISEADYEHIMRQTVEYENRENLIIMAYVIRRESSNEDHEFEYYHSMMLDTHNPNPNSGSCVIGGSNIFYSYDKCVIDMNDRLGEWVRRRYILEGDE
jgi:hypothetical protein